MRTRNTGRVPSQFFGSLLTRLDILVARFGMRLATTGSDQRNSCRYEKASKQEENPQPPALLIHLASSIVRAASGPRTVRPPTGANPTLTNRHVYLSPCFFSFRSNGFVSSRLSQLDGNLVFFSLFCVKEAFTPMLRVLFAEICPVEGIGEEMMLQKALLNHGGLDEVREWTKEPVGSDERWIHLGARRRTSAGHEDKRTCRRRGRDGPSKGSSKFPGSISNAAAGQEKASKTHWPSSRRVMVSI